MNTDPDQKLIQQARQGKTAAFGRLVRKYQDQILELAYDYLGNYEDARDAAQDVFMKAYRGLNGFAEKSRFSSWLYRIAVNHCLDVLRKRERFKREDRDLEQVQDGRVQDGGIDLGRAELSDAQHTAIVLRYFQDMSVAQIAEIMNCSGSTVRTHLYRAVAKIRRHPE